MTIDQKTLNAEERAIVEATVTAMVANPNFGSVSYETAYNEAVQSRIPIMRALFGSPASEPAAATAREKELRELRLLAEQQLTTLRKLKAEMLSDTRDAEIASLRAKAAEEGKVRMPKVRTLIEEVCSDRYDGKQYRHLLAAALAELDAVEGK